MAMANASLLEVFPTPTDAPITIEHIAEEFTSQCPVTGHPDFGVITLRFEPRAKHEGGVCVELKSLKLYLQSFRAEGIFYEAVTDRIRDDVARLMRPRWLLVHSSWRGRGGIRSIVRAEHGEVPGRFAL
jgi:7-cyano-7-deazaguanine reductase